MPQLPIERKGRTFLLVVSNASKIPERYCENNLDLHFDNTEEGFRGN